jgi:GxxExxY protein
VRGKQGSVHHRDTENTEQRKNDQIRRRTMDDGADELDPLTGAVIGAAIEVHRILGPGLLESVYQEALSHELGLRGIPFEVQVKVPIEYKGRILGDDLKMDVVVDGRVVLELKSVDRLDPIHEAQLLTYLRLSRIQVGLLINFNVRVLKDGIRRRVL